ncbi:MAG: hypothetical protein KUG81_06845, partial [Gammaproteobacteria bacterium]|nr:hypothetical protein [Gammaproteobacteria bacterium]
RVEALMVPARTALQFGQLQFHCGKPPPAPEPKTRICIDRVFLFGGYFFGMLKMASIIVEIEFSIRNKLLVSTFF